MIRERQAADDDAIRELNDAAFGGPDESRLIEDLRAARLAAVELVAVEGTVIVGHILFSLLAVTHGKKAIRALALAPMSVQPGQQRRGIGSALVRAGLGIAQARDWQAVFVLGHPDFYPRFGFSAALARPFKAPFSGEAFMALDLEPEALAGSDGRVVYPPPFGIAAD
ncbi:MAG: GNAT family N-acetyltransferase [Reyranella sp.]